jgi:ubiquinone/menaquinone biosynthesis C-methylase UbiE
MLYSSRSVLSKLHLECFQATWIQAMIEENHPASCARQRFLAYNTTRNAEARRYKEFENEWKYVCRLKALSRGTKFLDVGCGPGSFTGFWVDKGVEGNGIDVDLSLIRAATSRLERKGAKGRFVVGRVEALPYQTGIFDLCIANSILEHVSDWRATLQEISRVLKDGGMLVFSTTNKLHPFQQEINRFPFYPWIPEPIKKKILRMIMSHRPDLVNYTEYPAIHWFTYEVLKEYLEALDYRVCTRLDLIAKSDLRGWKAVAKPGLKLIQNIQPLRYLYYFYSADVSVYAIKQGPAS